MTNVRARLTALVMTLFAVLALAGGVMAQDEGFGLSSEDMALWSSANANSNSFDSVAYTFNMTLDVDPGDGSAPVAMDITGTGVLGEQDSLPVFSMDLTGTADTLGEVNLQVLFINDTAYINGIDPSMGWIAISQADMEMAAEGFGEGMAESLPFDPMALASGDPSALGIDPAAQDQIMADFAAFDPTAYIAMARLADEEGYAVFTTDVLVEDLIASDLLLSLVATGLTANDPTLTFEAAQEQAQSNLLMAGAFLVGSEVSFTQYIQPTTSLVEEGIFVIATGESSPVLLEFVFDIVIDEYNPVISLEAPADATPLSTLMGGM